MGGLRLAGFLGIYLFIGADFESSSAQSLSDPAPTEVVRLDSIGGTTEKLPVFDQESEGICYACQASTLIDAWRFSHGDVETQHITSPWILALDVVRAGYKTFDNSGLKMSPQALEQLREQQNSKNKVDLDPPKVESDPDKLYTDIWTRSSEVDCAEAYRKYGSCNASRAWAQMRVDQWGLDRRQASKWKQEDEAIGNRRLPPRNYFQVISRFYVKSDEYLITMDHYFLGADPKTTQPLALTYCGNLLEEGKDYQGLVSRGITFFWMYIQAKANCGPHAGVLIGRRKVGSKSQFLIHNSWGRFPNISSDWENDLGKIWVDGEALSKNTFSLDWLEEPEDLTNESSR